MAKPKVAIIGGDMNIERMFMKNNWEIVNNLDDADFLQFTGGADVDPMLYSEPKHPTTHSSPSRDSIEANIFNTYVNAKHMLGICRGAQFLNVMSGGSMWQNVNNHAIGGTHKAFDKISGEEWNVTSTHHQMMSPSEDGDILVTAGLTTFKEDGYTKYMSKLNDNNRDCEVVFYEDTDSLCFQPHPEYVDPEEDCQRLYFQLIKHMFN